MIKFFRKIRQKNLFQNKFSKYLLYAIGEIILVVIGILIALQINNANENKKLVGKEIKILKEIKSELEGSLKDLISDIDDQQRNLNSAIIIRDAVLYSEKYNDSLNEHFLLMIDHEVLTAKMSAFESLKSIGLEIISNDTIRKKITSTYLDMKRFTNEESDPNKTATKLASMLEPHIILNREKFRSDPELRKKMYWGRKIPIKLINYNELLSNELFFLCIIDSIESRNVEIFVSKIFKENVEEVLSDINKELKRLE